MTNFNTLPNDNNIQELIKATFNTDLSLSGNWGYTKEDATIIQSLPKGMLLPELEHMITSIRSHLEMNLTQKDEDRYGGINANEKNRETIVTKEGTFSKITYEVTAMKETLYATFIKEYKEGYGKKDFNLTDHFKNRGKATLTREIIHYFEVSQL